MSSELIYLFQQLDPGLNSATNSIGAITGIEISWTERRWDRCSVRGCSLTETWETVIHLGGSISLFWTKEGQAEAVTLSSLSLATHTDGAAIRQVVPGSAIVSPT